MLSIIVTEHQEGKESIQKMLSLFDQIPYSNSIPEKELIYVSSSSEEEFNKNYGPFSIPFKLVPNINKWNNARDIGFKYAKGDDLLFVDSHVCWTSESINMLISTLHNHPDALITPTFTMNDFPTSCGFEHTGKVYGLHFEVVENDPLKWVWNDLPQPQTLSSPNQEFAVPFSCGCMFAIKRETYGLFITKLGGSLPYEEEKSLRLWRVGIPTYCEPRSLFSHLFKGHTKNRAQDNARMWNDSRPGQDLKSGQVVMIYINIFNNQLYKRLEDLMIKNWGLEYYNIRLEYAKANYQWLREMLSQYKDTIDETWFFR